MRSNDHGGRRRPIGLMALSCVAVLALSALHLAVTTPATAQDDAASANKQQADEKPSADESGIDPETGEMRNFGQVFMKSPVINSIIIALSVVALFLFLFFLTTVNTAAMAPPGFVDDVTKLVINQQFREATDLCRSRPGVFIASIVQRCVENADKQHSVILDILDTEGKRRADILWNRISYLADISNVAPMLGLFGTVYGMMRTFAAARFTSLSASSGALTEGVAQAMSTTLFGLAVAILALAFYSIVKSRATKVLSEIEHTVHTIADHIKRNEA